MLQNPHDIAYLTVRMLLQYLGKLKIQISPNIQPIWKKMQTNYILLASNFVIRPQILIFLLLTNEVSFPTLIANKLVHVTVLLVFWFLLLRSICGTDSSSQQTSLQCLSTVNMVFSDEDKIFQQKFAFEGVHSKEVYRRIS